MIITPIMFLTVKIVYCLLSIISINVIRNYLFRQQLLSSYTKVSQVHQCNYNSMIVTYKTRGIKALFSIV